MSRSAAGEAVHVAAPAQVERGALDVLPAERAADGNAQILTRQRRRLETVETETRDAPGAVARRDTHAAKRRAAKAGCVQRPQQIAGAKVRRPLRRPAARIVGLRRQVGRVLVAGPDVGRHRRVSTARGAVVHRGRHAVAQQQPAGRRAGGALGRSSGASEHLTVRLIAEIETVRAMAAEIRGGKRSHRDRQRLERRRLAVARRLARDHARNVGLDRHVDDGVSAACLRDADAHRGRGQISIFAKR